MMSDLIILSLAVVSFIEGYYTSPLLAPLKARLDKLRMPVAVEVMLATLIFAGLYYFVPALGIVFFALAAGYLILLVSKLITFIAFRRFG